MKPAPAASALDGAIAHHQAGRLDAALAVYRALRARFPRDAQAAYLGGLALLQLGRPAEAASWLEAAVALAPRTAAAWMCLGVALGRLERPVDAERALRRATGLDPANGEAWTNLGLSLDRLGRTVDALDALRRGAESRPRDPAGRLAWARALVAAGRPVEALTALEAAGDPAGVWGGEVWSARAAAHHALGRMQEARAAFDRALVAAPGHEIAAGQRLLVLHYLDDVSAQALATAHRDYGRALRSRIGPSDTMARRPAGTRPRRVGFFSPDLREHAVASFLEPLLPGVAEAGVEVFFYHNHPHEDAVSERLRGGAAGWRNLSALDDDTALARMRADGLDAVVDLAGHTGRGRPVVFARRAAPVQINYLGYPDGTGIDTMDYRLTDALADPPGLSDGHVVERLVRFSSCAWCYRPPCDVPEPPPPPAGLDPNRPPVFGSFNHLGKTSPATWALWGRVLAAVPGSRLLLKGTPPNPGWLENSIKAAGITPDRVVLLPFSPTRAGHFSAYAEMDVALDPVPYHGTTTTCEALWMGRPVVSLAGDHHVRRVGVSLLTAVGQGDCVAANPDAFVDIACRLVADRAALVARSAGLREAVRRSPLGTSAGQGRAFAAALIACMEGTI